MFRVNQLRRIQRIAPSFVSSTTTSSSQTRRLLSSSSSPSGAGTKVNAYLHDQLRQIEADGLFKRERVITSPQEAEISVQGRQAKVLNFCANNYLGLSDHPEIVAAAERALHTHGTGLSSVRFICGTQDIHKELEATVAKFHGMEDAILYPSCFDANAGFFEALFTNEDAIISDALNHASIIDGVRLCKAQRFRYAHMDMVDLEKQLVAAKDARFRVIVTDGVFSMDGDVAPLPEICDLAEKYDALVFIDECHATGFFGRTGRGTVEHHGVEGRVHVINSTLGKAMGGATGGYTAASKEIVTMLRQKSRPYLFSNSVAPAVVGASQHAYNMIMSSDVLVRKLHAHVSSFRAALKQAGFTVLGNDASPIVPVLLNEARLAADFADKMLERGIYVIGFSFPVVPKGQARIRVQLSAAHTPEHVQKCIQAFVDVGRELKVIN